MEVKSLGNSRYFLLLKDDYSHFRIVIFLNRKSKVYEKLKDFFIKAEIITGNKVKIFRSDKGTEFLNENVNKLFEDNGITHQKSVSYTPQQNGRAEREMRTIVESARTMLNGKNLEKELWAEAINTAVFILNRAGTSPVHNKTPYELWCKKTLTLNNYKIGC